jgi:hypothetical protein
VNYLQAVTFVQSGRRPVIAADNFLVQFNGDAIGLEAQLAD